MKKSKDDESQKQNEYFSDTINTENKKIIKFNNEIYSLKQDNKYYRLVDKETGYIKNIFKKKHVILKPKNTDLNKKGLSNFDKRLVPQKENLDRISKTPILLKVGINNPQKISTFFGESRRHGSFYLTSCEILGWCKNGKLTGEGKKLINAKYHERIKLTEQAIKRSKIYNLLKNKFQDKIKNNIDKKEISLFLENELDFSKSTAKRRSNTILSWLKFLKSDKTNFNHKKYDVILPYVFKGIFFDGCYINENGNPSVFFLNGLYNNIDDLLEKILSIDEESFKYVFFINNKLEERFKIIIEIDNAFLKYKIRYIKVPDYVIDHQLYFDFIMKNEDEFKRLIKKL